MTEKPDIVKQYEQRKQAGESPYFDPVEFEDIFHYYCEEGMEDEAEKVLHDAEALHPGDFIVTTLKAEYLLNMDDAQGCLDCLEPIFDSTNVMHCILRSGAMAKLDRLPEAITYGELAMEGDDPLIAYDIGLGFMNADQPTLALRYYDRCLSAYPEDIRTLQAIILCLNQVGSPEEVIQYADRALEVDSYCADAWLAKGNALGEQDKWKEAEECCDYALAIVPNSGDCLTLKTTCCIQQNRMDDALVFAEEASKNVYGGQKANVLLLLAHLYAEKGRKKEAVESIWQAVEAEPTDKDLMFRAAVAFSDNDEPHAAITLLRYRFTREGERTAPEVLSLLGEQYSRIGWYNEAVAPYEMLTKQQPGPASWTLLAGTYMSLYKFRKAYQLLLKAKEGDLIWQTYVLLAVCAHEMGWETAAESHYITAYQLSASGARDLLQALSPLLVESFEQKGIFRKAEQWRQRQIAKEIQKAKKIIK